MARPRKYNADYFPHDANERNKPAVRAIRRKYSHVGYALWNFLQETLADSEYFRIQWDGADDVSIELLAADYDVDADLLREFVGYAVKIGLLHKEEGAIFSPELCKSLTPLTLKRQRERNEPNNQPNSIVSDSDNPDNEPIRSDNPEIKVLGDENPPETPEADIENPQSKVKESKVKESIEDNTYTHITSLDLNIKKSAEIFLKWIADRFPDIAGMPEPLDETQAVWLVKKYDTEDLRRIIAQMHNNDVAGIEGGEKKLNTFSTLTAYIGQDYILKEKKRNGDNAAWNQQNAEAINRGFLKRRPVIATK